MTETPLVINNVSYHYRHPWTGLKIKVLHDISFEVGRGECFGLLGHNGAGKTTTIKCILGLVKPSGGKVLIEGKDPFDKENRKKIGFIPEQPYFYEHLTVTELLELALRLSGLKREEINEKVRDAILLSGLEGREKHALRMLSKGLQQRVALAQAVCHDPEILILDEPFSGLDPVGRKEFREIFLELKRKGKTIVISTHLMSDVELLCDRIGILKKGSLKGEYLVNEITTQGDRYELRFKTSASFPEGLLSRSIKESGLLYSLKVEGYEEGVKALQQVLADGGEVVSFMKEGKSIEDLFVSIVRG